MPEHHALSPAPMIALTHEKQEHAETLLVNWLMGDTCTLACRYCAPSLHEGAHAWVDLPTVRSFHGRVAAQYRSGHTRRIYYCLNGGEITCHPQLPEIAAFLKKEECGIALLSNGNREQGYWETILPDADHLCLSYHPSGMTEKRFIETVAVAIPLVTTHVNIMMDPDHFERSRALGEYLLEHFDTFTMNVPPLMRRLGLDSSLMDYTDEQRRIMTGLETAAAHIRQRRIPAGYRGAMVAHMSDGTLETISAGQLFGLNRTCFRGWECGAGLEMISIFYDGDIYPAWCFEGNKMNRIGNVHDSVLRFPDRPQICPFDICWDNSDIMMTKRRRISATQ